MSLIASLEDTLNALNVVVPLHNDLGLDIHSPVTGEMVGVIRTTNATKLEQKTKQLVIGFNAWRNVPAPKRGELVRLFANVLRDHKEALATLVSIENGKILEEGRGEVQEMIDICDFAVGLSRQIGGLTLPSERTNHTMHENWLPLGPIGVISAFNFPVAVWSWNTALALICGDTVMWKPSEKTPLTALACEALFHRACGAYDLSLKGSLLEVAIGDATLGKTIAKDARFPLISATGSTAMGKKVAPVVAERFGKCILELGGNNAIVMCESADLDICLPSVVFGAVGTAGQRCTTTRRLFVHQSLYKDVKQRLQQAYSDCFKRIGNPLESETLIGPLIDEFSYLNMQKALAHAQEEGSEVFGGKRVLKQKYPKAFYVEPALVFCAKQTDIVMQETFAPVLYIMPFTKLDDVMEAHNAVPQGLSSAIFTNDLREAELFKRSSDCGIVNVNIGTSGAEIGGAFGGEKETGGGRESGSDAWKAYMRRQTSTTYYGYEPPALAQGVKFS